jgi:hypothetical protein
MKNDIITKIIEELKTLEGDEIEKYKTLLNELIRENNISDVHLLELYNFHYDEGMEIRKMCTSEWELSHCFNELDSILGREVYKRELVFSGFTSVEFIKEKKDKDYCGVIKMICGYKDSHIEYLIPNHVVKCVLKFFGIDDLEDMICQDTCERFKGIPTEIQMINYMVSYIDGIDYNINELKKSVNEISNNISSTEDVDKMEKLLFKIN